MFNRKKIGSSPSVAKPENRLFRLLRPETTFQAFPLNLERKDQPQLLQENRIAIGNAMLQAEYNKAKATMALQQARNFY